MLIKMQQKMHVAYLLFYSGQIMAPKRKSSILIKKKKEMLLLPVGLSQMKNTNKPNKKEIQKHRRSEGL